MSQRLPLLPVIRLACLALLLLLTAAGCQRSPQAPDPAFTEKVSAYTSGTISSGSVIRVVLAQSVPGTVTPNSDAGRKLFRFKPAVKGQTVWIDNRTLEFRPDAPLKSGHTYKVKFYLSKVLSVPRKLAVMPFSFSVVKQAFSCRIDGYQNYSDTDLTLNRLKGTLRTADGIDPEKVAVSFKAAQGKTALTLHWEPGEDNRTFRFTADSVRREQQPSTVTITWDATSVQRGLSGSTGFEMPAAGDFRLLDVTVVQQPEQMVRLMFSDPLKRKQDFDGLVYLNGGTSLNYTVDGNVLQVYPVVRQNGTDQIGVRAGILNVSGKALATSATEPVTFEMPLPAVRLTGKGVILPTAGGLVFPFEAINLSAVDVKVIKIFENNIGYFLQVNQLDGNEQLKRAGRLIHRQTVDLSHEPVDLSKWNRFHLDLEQLIRPDPGAIYRIEISFRKKYSLYFCEGQPEQGSEKEEAVTDDSWDEGETSYWDSYEDYYDYYEGYGYDYNWEERDNPCTSSFYTADRWIARNILASDLGIIAKEGDDGLLCAVTNLTDSKPLAGVELSLLNYQQQVMSSGKTDRNGFAELKYTGKPFLVIARYEKQRGYLRLDDGSSLSLGAFDVSGDVVQKGIKGFIYGERGVWRPGDTLFTTFVVEDRQDVLPEGHPVIFELYGPQGQLYNRTVKTSGTGGFYCAALPTDAEVPTGNWNLRVKAGGAVFEKTLKVETVKPNRLKIDLSLGVPRISASDPDVTGTLTSRWLHGAVAGNLRATVSVVLTEENTVFPSYSSFQFTDPSREFSSEEQEVFDGTTDATGTVQVPAGITAASNAPGMLKANFTVRVFERGGDFSVDRFSVPFSPYRVYVGLRTPEGDKRGMLLTDTTHRVDVVTLDEDGKPMSVGNLEATVYKLNWRNWWEPDGGELANYMGNTYNDPVVSTTLSTRNGKGSFSFRIDRPEWGRFYVRVADPEGGHAAGRIIYVDWPGWAGRPMRENPEAASMLSFNSDKKKYNVGETAELIVPTGGTGNLLLSIESGSRILMKKWITAANKETRIKIPLTADMAPNVYAHVMLVQPHATSANDMPMRLYGVIPIFVEDPGTRLTPELSLPAELAPLKPFTVQVSEKNRKAMTYTLAIVEEGLLDLTRYKTPDPWSRFYAREALGVKTWDLYDQVIGAYGGKWGSLLGIGGDDEINPAGGTQKANRFKPVVRFIGPFSLAAGSIDRHRVSLPNYIGSVRVMVVAGQQGAYGAAEKTVPVKKPLMVLATLPRVMGPGEAVRLPVTVFAMDPRVKNVRVDVSTNNLLAAQSTSQTLTFSQTGDQVVYFDLNAAGNTGVGKVKVKATSGSLTAEYDVELNVRNANPPVTSFVAGTADAGKTWEAAFEMPGMDNNRTAVLEVSGIPPIDADRRLKYLIQYPHGCIEQTTSTVFAQLSLSDVMELDDKFKTAIDKHLRDGIRKITGFQVQDGGFSYWPGELQADNWGTSYAGHFLLEAEKKGYVIPAGVKSSWIRYQKRQARLWKSDPVADRYRQTDLEQAYRLYTLALAGQPETGAMNRMREQGSISLQAKWRLAAAYALAGQTAAAREMVNRAETDVPAYSWAGSSYGSRERDWAMILESLSLLQDRTRSAELARRISDALSSSMWMSTQTTAYCLLSMARFSKGLTASELRFSYRIDNAQPAEASTGKSIVRISLNRPSGKTGTIRVKNLGSGMLFARLIMTGTPEAGMETDYSRSLQLSVSYRNGDEPVDLSRITQGSDFQVVVSIRNTGLEDARQLALTQIFPSGWEISNPRLSGTEEAEKSVFTYQDVRDDRVYTYFDLRRGEQKTFVLSVNAAYLGRFYLPGTRCEAMYDDRTGAMQKGQWTEVVSP